MHVLLSLLIGHFAFHPLPQLDGCVGVDMHSWHYQQLFKATLYFETPVCCAQWCDYCTCCWREWNAHLGVP